MKKVRFFGILSVLVGLLLLGWLFVAPKQKPVSTPSVSSPRIYDEGQFVASAHKVSKQVLIQRLGVAVSDTGLDFYGKPAKVYRYHGPSEAPFYVVDSHDLLEVVWYDAKDSDSEQQKQQSFAYAKRAYGMLAPWLGDSPQRFFVALLNQKPAPLPKGVHHAQCRHYRCRVVLSLSEK